ncbi:MAG: alginate export family protein [Candidatus Omnitrophica bacterium]|nr:alginate export family protein [Candidatus Omnitrophota bacterium]
MEIKRKYGFIFALTLVGVLVSQPVFAEVTFKWGPYMRIRHEYWKNWKSVNGDVKENRNFFRIKTSLWGQADIDKNFGLYAKLTNENKAYAYFPQGSGKKGFHYQINEVVFDNLFVDLKNIGDMPLDVRAGRQDLMGLYGEGFLFSDGTPQDGSRTTYFDAIKTSYRINKKSSFDFLAIDDHKTDDVLPIINRLRPEQAMNLSDELGFAAIYKNDEIKNLHMEPFYVFKEEEDVSPSTIFNNGITRLHTVGGYAKYAIDSTTTLKGQLAFQTGETGTKDREGVGGYTYLTKTFKQLMYTPTVNMGYMYLSGDNKKTDKIEAWDPLFSRWPILSDFYSELLYLSMSNAKEGGAIGYWQNLQSYKLGFIIVPTKKTKLSLAYYYLRANNTVPADTTTFGTGKDRGMLYTAKLDYAFNKNISAYVMGEFFHPGNFYVDRSDALFLRSQLELKY